MSSTGELRKRAAAVEAARAALRAGKGVLVVGAPGSGRSRLVRDVLQGLDETPRVKLWLREEVHLLNEEQADRLARAVAAGTVLPFVTALAHRPVPRILEGLWAEREFLRIDLGPLSARELLHTVDEFLGGPLEASTAPSFVPPRGGTDLQALERALTEAQTSGALARDEGAWSLTGPIPASGALRRLLLSRVCDHDPVPDVTETMIDILALTPGVTLSNAATVCRELALEGSMEDALERLEEQGIVEVLDQPGGPRLLLRDGVMELLLPQTLGVLRRRRITTAIIDVLDRVPSAELATGEVIALGKNALAMGRELDPGTLTRAARASLRGADTALALHLSRAAVDKGGGTDAEMALAAAESQAGRSDDALARLERLLGSDVTDPQRGEALRALMLHAIERAGQPELPAAILTGSPADEEGALRADAVRGFMINTLGDSVGAAELIEPALGVLVGEELAHAYYVVANASMLRGRLGHAREALDRAESLFTEAGLDASRVHLTRAFLDSFEGGIPRSLAVVQQFRDAAGAFGQWVAQAMCNWAVGVLLMFSGRASESVAELQSAVAALERAGLTKVALLVRTDLATVLALVGDEGAAMDALAPALDPAEPAFALEPKALQASGWIHLCAGRVEEATRTFLRAADAYDAPGHDMATLIVLVDAARAGGACRVLDRVEALAHTVEGAFAGLCVRYARVLAALERLEAEPREGAAQLASELDEIAEQAAEWTMHLISAEAYARAVPLHLAAGDVRGSACSARKRDEQLARCKLDRLSTTLEHTTSPLSPREKEIARLAASGLSNRAIAEQLVVSVRTVETHLQRIYLKLGLRRRSELDSVL